ncbi:MAG: hypothetical protein CL920_33600 [Deltaproteobacteria bacterium]|nr:hypothetical protein [Deltaproteobacteria bacterium]MBU53660.1 hypothetical protein [Deltaproteobacteria bacterium]
MSDEFLRGLKQLDETYQQHELSPEANARILRKLRGEDIQPVQPTRAIQSWHYALVAVGALMVIVWGGWRPAAQHWQQFSWRGQAIKRVGTQGLQCQLYTCDVQDRALRVSLTLHEQAMLRRQKHGLQLQRGTAFFDVVPRRRRQQPLRIFVSHGYIEVLGTAFTIVQDRRSGSVRLHRGKILFVGVDGRRVLLKPGQALFWPLRKRHTHDRAIQRIMRNVKRLRVPVRRRAITKHHVIRRKAPHHPAKMAKVRRPDEYVHEPEKVVMRKPPRRVSPPTRVAPPIVRRPKPPKITKTMYGPKFEQLLFELRRLRGQGRYDRAVHMLRDKLSTFREQGAKEVLSFELGSILTHQLKRRRASCAHWRSHLQVFQRSTRYKASIRRYMRELSCP